MKFHEWQTQYERLGRGMGMSPEQFLNHVWNTSQGDMSRWGAYWFGVCQEYEWVKSCRPYYKVWPSFIDALCRVPFSVKREDLAPPISRIAIRFCDKNRLSLTSILAVFTEVDDRFAEVESGSLAIAVYSLAKGEKYPSTKSIVIYPKETVTESMSHAPKVHMEDGVSVVKNSVDGIFKVSAEESRINEIALRIVLALCLFANDPDFFSPDVIASDAAKFDASSDQEFRQRLIDKAKKRGIVGWRIGQEYETIPHFRRPHFALRHTGKGRTVPRIVPVKGCVVHREKMTKVPTGYITPEGVEVEPE